ncbi:ABC-type transporter Mla subunit MlaD [Actinoplanes lutulentus]|uniref:hypothetical protein n=1 Tax=Actinoplanes lutulentus TaxID=1287878 RepID=UPI000DBAB1ED|nr:hypothetical protein [Actinoplanes lutulentus]MBB2945352.1 ABC-type transporter Mla subunit MlaD [Actinoplanes lutulentus]
MFRVAQQVAVSPPWWATVVIAGLFTLLGAILTLTVTVTLDRRKAARDARMAREVRAREAYLRILTWVTHIKDELRRTIDGRREFNHALVDEREQASLGALSQLDTGPQFRELLRQWPVTFRTLLDAYETLHQTERNLRATSSSEYALRDKQAAYLTDMIDELAELITEMEKQARKDTSMS